MLRRALPTVLTLLATLALGAPGAQASVRFGPDTAAATATDDLGCLQECNLVQLGVASPASGVVVGWRLRTGPNSEPQAVRLRIFRSTGGGGFRAVGRGPEVGITAEAKLHEQAVRLPIAAGDQLGLQTAAGRPAVVARAEDGASTASINRRVDNGTTAAPTATSAVELLVDAVVEADADTDGYGDETQDNCPGVANAQQSDADRDGTGDACEADDDGDGIADEADTCPLVAGTQTDTDGDGQGDPCDVDDDDDGIADVGDNCPLVANPTQGNVDLDKLGDACDPTDDRQTTPTPPSVLQSPATPVDPDQPIADPDVPPDLAFDQPLDAPVDSDLDRLEPPFEPVRTSGRPTVAVPVGDADGDGLDTAAERRANTKVRDSDTDDDGLSDGEELRLRTDPRRSDSDRDGLADGLELGRTRPILVRRTGVRATSMKRFRPDRHPRSRTDPRKRDTDADGRTDGSEDRNHNGRVDRGESNPRRGGHR